MELVADWLRRTWRQRGSGMRIRLSGYQGAASVHTRGLHHLSADLTSLGLNPEITDNVTTTGLAAKALFDAVEREDAHICYMASGYLTERVSALAVLDLPMAAPERLRAHEALDGLAGRLLTDHIEQATDFHVLGFWDNGVRHITNRVRPIRSVSDCSGLVVRTLDNTLYQDALRAFGFRPIVTDVRDLVDAVASGKVDAQENPIANTLRFGLHKHHRHLSLTGHIAGVALLLCHSAWFHALPAETAAGIEAAAARSTQAQRAWAIEEDRIGLEQFRASGVEVVERGELDLGSFKNAAMPVLKEAISRLDTELVKAYFGDEHPVVVG
jgi:TRAP-type C4-dicarboxylate transport system substrate-binding protein